MTRVPPAGTVASAPGKVMLAGEYAVLAGGQAVVAAVGRRAVARLVDVDPPPSPFLTAVRDVLASVRGPDSVAARAAARIVVDSRALAAHGKKLGRGSSAATTVAAVALALALDPDAPDHARDPDAWRALVWRLGRAAHAAAQGRRGAPGSGADVAAATFGGVVSVRGEVVRAVHLPAGLVVRAIWTGHPADTATLVVAVQTLASRDPARHDAHMAALAAASDDLLAATTVPTAIAALDAGGVALAALGDDVARAGGPILEPPLVAELRALARARGGTAKTTGAGGGDVAIIAVPLAADDPALAAALRMAGATPLDLHLGEPGARVEG